MLAMKSQCLILILYHYRQGTSVSFFARNLIGSVHISLYYLFLMSFSVPSCTLFIVVYFLIGMAHALRSNLENRLKNKQNDFFHSCLKISDIWLCVRVSLLVLNLITQ